MVEKLAENPIPSSQYTQRNFDRDVVEGTRDKKVGLATSVHDNQVEMSTNRTKL